MGKIILITGGARSGKSSFAEKYAAKYGNKIAYIATSQIFDEEMRFRIKLHQKRRPENWTTFEAPFDGDKAILEAGQNNDMLLFDCITMYISNLLCNAKDIEDSDANYKALTNSINRLIEAVGHINGTAIFVTNEVGSGIVPDNRLSREYRDLAGMANQMLAAAADKVFLVVSGIPVDVKKIAEVLE